jgi:hypothetical protein
MRKVTANPAGGVRKLFRLGKGRATATRRAREERVSAADRRR